MNMRMSNRWNVSAATVAVLTCSAIATTGPSDDWPQWRGPERTGVSAETSWSSQGAEKALWERSVGLGYSSVVVDGDRLYTMGWHEEGGQDTIVCLDANTGKPIWSTSYEAEKWDKYHGGGTNSTPSLDGDKLWVLNREGRLTVLNAGSGKTQFTEKLVDDKDKLPTWGLAASPLVLNDMVVVNSGPVIAYNKSDHSVLWKTRDLGHAYSTPLDFEYDGKSYIAVVNGEGLSVVDRGNGKVLATQPWKTQYDVNASTPIIVDGSRIFISSGYGHGCGLFEFDGSGLKEIWASKVMRTKMTGCVLVDGYLYGFDESVLKCIDLNGKEMWSERGLGMGTLSATPDRLIIMSGKGELIIAKATPKGFEPITREKVLDGGVYWTMPVLSDGRIYCRNSLGNLTARNHKGE